MVIDKILSLPYDNLCLYPGVDDYSKDRDADIIRRDGGGTILSNAVLQA